MNACRPAAWVFAVIGIGACVLIASGQSPTQGASTGRARLPLEPLGLRGEAIFPAVEGWGPHKDGGTVILVGYFNRNSNQVLDIPIGEDNRIEPGGPDLGQPTHFEPGRQYGVFSIQVPKDFGARRLAWTLTANGHATVVQLSLNPAYWIDFFKNHANGNEPPVIKFAENGPELTGPPRGFAQTLLGTVGQPVRLTVWARDQASTHNPPVASPGAARSGAAEGRRATGRGTSAPAIIGGQVLGGNDALRGALEPGAGPPADIVIGFAKHRGPGEIRFAQSRIPLKTTSDPKMVVKAETVAIFSEAGEYWVRVTANDQSGDGGLDQCCWTTAHVKVHVK